MELKQLGPYRISRELGRGGMGTVYLGVDDNTGAEAALKVLTAARSDESSFQDRFAAEIETLKALRHPNIVELFGYGEQDGHLFYAMEYVRGLSLEQELRNGRRFQWREVARMSIDICRALKHAHDSGVVHRDLKPANLLLDAEENVKLTDFGIAKLFGSSQLTTVGDVMGTADYMSPEQAQGERVNHRCDLFSLGSVMYALLTGRPPFFAKSLPEVLHHLRFDDPIPVGRKADVPEEMERIVQELLEKESRRRPPTARVVMSRLEAMLKALSIERVTGERSEETDAHALPHGPIAVAPQDRPKRTLGGVASQKTAAPGGIELADQDGRQASPDFETAVEGEAAAEASPQTAPTTSGHFTMLEKERESAAEYSPTETHRNWWTILAGLVALGAIIVSLWYAFRPPTADALYQRITAAAEEGEEKLALAESDIQDFLDRFPDDQRHPDVAEYQEDVRLYRLRRRLERRVRQRASGDGLLPVEQVYLEAIRLATLEPEVAAARLAALIDIYQNADDDERTALCVALAERQLARLEQDLAETSKLHLAELNRRLEQAEDIAVDDRTAAEAIWRGIILLYADKPWAREAVETARQRLGN
jgi:tRNA A-37 threonylcarbamoyl transferase component Bud32/TolA-binding protein